MVDIVDRLKSQARVLHRQAQKKDTPALTRLRKLNELRQLDDDTLSSTVKRRHCLAVMARELGFNGWSHATAVLGGRMTKDFGTLLYPGRCHGHTNIWLASLEEAQSVHAKHGGYLLAYKNQFLVVDDDYIRSLGLDPDDSDWRLMGHDWVKPKDPTARKRLYGKVIAVSLDN